MEKIKLSKRQKLKLYTDVDKISCLVCGEKCLQITAKHTLKHGITMQEYIEKFPDAKLICDKAAEEKSKRISAAKKGTVAHNKGKPNSIEQNLKQSITMKEKFASGGLIHWNQGNITSEHTKQKISDTLANKSYWSNASTDKRNITIKHKIDNGWVSPLKGKSLSDEHKQKIFIAAEKNKKLAHERRIITISNKCVDKNLKLIHLDEENVAHIECLTCNTNFSYHKQIFNSSKKYVEKICPTCNPRNSGDSELQQKIHEYIKSIYGGEVLYNSRNELNGKELDIYLPEIKLAFEINGVYWHSQLISNLHIHHTLHKQQHAFSVGIKVITIFEDEIRQHENIVMSRIANLLNATTDKIYARKCQVKIVDTKAKNMFLTNNHIQGADIGTSCNVGAYYNNELVAIMTFKPTNYVKGGDGTQIELSRFCSKLNTNVVGIASKLFKAYTTTNSNIGVIISYADRRWSLGHLYKTLGFVYQGHTKPNYWYMKNYISRMHRSNFMKHKLKDMLEHYDPNLTEWENMQNNGYDRIWDCGSTKWLWTRT